jgi:hypothetical protein
MLKKYYTDCFVSLAMTVESTLIVGGMFGHCQDLFKFFEHNELMTGNWIASSFLLAKTNHKGVIGGRFGGYAAKSSPLFSTNSSLRWRLRNEISRSNPC